MTRIMLLRAKAKLFIKVSFYVAKGKFNVTENTDNPFTKKET